MVDSRHDKTLDLASSERKLRTDAACYKSVPIPVAQVRQLAATASDSKVRQLAATASLLEQACRIICFGIWLLASQTGTICPLAFGKRCGTGTRLPLCVCSLSSTNKQTVRNRLNILYDLATSLPLVNQAGLWFSVAYATLRKHTVYTPSIRLRVHCCCFQMHLVGLSKLPGARLAR